MRNEQDYFLRGNSFLYEEMQPHFVIKWIEPIQREILQESVQEVIQRSPWVCWSLADRADAPKLLKAQGPFTVHDRYEKRAIPETPGGYLFSMSCENDTIHFVYDHFLTDGRGIVWLISAILLAYCNRAYGTNTADIPLKSAQLPEFSELLKCASQNPHNENITPLSKFDQKAERLLLRIDKKEMVQKAVSLEIKPFALLLSILCRGVMLAKKQMSVSYSYTLDARKGFDCADVFYHFSTGVYNTVNAEGGIQGMQRHFHDMICRTAEPAVVRAHMAQGTRLLNDLAEMKIPHTTKRKVYQKLSALERVTVRTSYLGNVFPQQYEILNRFVSDFILWLDSNHEEFLFLETTLRDQMIITLSHYADNATVAKCLLAALNESGIHGVQVCDGGKYGDGQ